MSQKTKRNILVITVGAIFLFFIAPGDIFPLLVLVGITIIFVTVLAYLFIPKAP